MSWATDRHNWTRQRIWRRIDEYLDTRHIGRAWVEQAFRITPDTARIPDAAFATFERYGPSYLDKNVMPFVPDLAVEVVSATGRAEEIRDKVCDYLDNGADTVWVVYLNRRQAEIWERGAPC